MLSDSFITICQLKIGIRRNSKVTVLVTLGLSKLFEQNLIWGIL